MNNEEHQRISDDAGVYQSFSERRFGLSTSRFLLLISAVAAILFYLWIIIFGNNSLLVLISLEEHQDFLINDIEHLKSENAALQKQYFELKELDADSVSKPTEELP